LVSGRIPDIKKRPDYPAGYPAGQFGIRPDTGDKKKAGLSGDIRQGNLVSGRIPDIKKRPDYPGISGRAIWYPAGYRI
jgi:hypothetical protein